MEITGEQVILRSMEEQDEEMLKDLIEDPKIARVTGGYSGPVSYDHQINWFHCAAFSGSGLHRIIADKDNPRTGVGIIILSDTGREEKKAEIYIKVARAFRRKGYGRDAVAALVSYGFRELGLNYIYANILEYNTASRRLFETCGFKPEEIHKSRADKDGHGRRVYVYGKRWEQPAGGAL